ncbi:hypothetical protein [Chromobacterium vaccinii]|uniref:hypothetical protein n=1 Tax=Chromobacterium vaccinii TaxID=1108595 RepID=UPI001E297C40|nr:hypothetical protein [Chromobacterium vaccinii]MCD4498780.1 hypothetical protein [Chromobacterium vaccinii]
MNVSDGAGIQPTFNKTEQKAVFGKISSTLESLKMVAQCDDRLPAVGGYQSQLSSMDVKSNALFLGEFFPKYIGIRQGVINSYSMADDVKDELRNLSVNLKKVTDDLVPLAESGAIDDIANGELKKVVSDALHFMDALPKMENELEVSGGYKADKSKGEEMLILAKSLSDLQSCGSLRAANGGGVDIPVIRREVFMNSKNGISPSLKKLVRDIWSHHKGGVVLDTRTVQQRENKTITADQTGALRSWHLNGHRSLPPLNGVLDESGALHQHYKNTSQDGNAHTGGGPVGYAEYTGIDSHNNKIVLDYVSDRLFITATHYKYWVPEGDGAHVLSGSLTQSQNEQSSSQNLSGDIKSPWVAIDMKGEFEGG